MFDRAEIEERHAAVQERIAQAARRAGRSPDEVTLVAVTKTWPAELILAAYEAGLRHFGENRAEELAAKRPVVEQALGRDSGITWHLIGALQSRKTALAAGHADLFHALDRLKIAARLSQALSGGGRALPSLIEVNLSGETTKSGLACSRWETDATQWNELRIVIKEIAVLPGLPIVGLMTIAPWEVEPDVIRSVFRRMRELARRLESDLGLRLPYLSMGMTDDFEIAVEEGATHVRVGRALFGERTG